MKKKGLIISTLVMVVVLIAALTTTTFAWFSADAAATVEGLSISANSASSVQIGLMADPSKTATDLSAVTDVFSGQNAAFNTTWSSPTKGFGPTITFSEIESLATMEKAVSIATQELKDKDVEETVTIAKDEFYMANGNGSTGDYNGFDRTTLAKAEQNKHYFDAAFCVVAVRDNIKQIYMTITVTCTSSDTLGMAAAIHFGIYIDGKLFLGKTGKLDEDSAKLSVAESIDAFDGLKYENNYGIKDGAITENKSNKGTSSKAAGSPAVWTYVVEVAKSDSNAFTALTNSNFSTATKHVVRVLAWIEGTDDSCRNDNTDTGAEIKIEFNGVPNAGTITNGQYTPYASD